MSAYSGTTLVTYSRRAGSRSEYLSARAAGLLRYGDGERRQVNQFGMTFPECLFRFAVARRAKRDQVRQIVRVPVIAEQAEGTNVMNLKIGRDMTAMLAGVVIPFYRRMALVAPVRATTIGMPAAPCRAIGAKPIIGTSPKTETRAGAEVELMDSIRLFLDVFAACDALDGDALPPNADPVHSLPLAVTFQTAKVMLGQIGHVRLGFVPLTALFAGECDHTPILH